MTDAPQPLHDDALSQIDGVRHGFFTRQGGVSDGIFAGLNIGLGSADDQAVVAENRARAMAALDLPATALNTLYQIHSPDVVVVDKAFDPDALPKADGMVTDRPGLALGIATADCAPVLFADDRAGVIGACHSGWKGAIGGVVAATVAAMEGLGADRSRIIAVLGPCIHQVSYEVGPEFYAQFVAQDAAMDRFFGTSSQAGYFQFDLPGFVLDRMRASGIGQIGHIAEDTYADPNRFYSFRRATHRKERNADGSIDYGRLLSAIALMP